MSNWNNNNNGLTLKPLKLLGSSFREIAVSAEVTFAIKIAMMMRPKRIHMIEKMRATMDFGALSPYLMHKNRSLLIYGCIYLKKCFAI